MFIHTNVYKWVVELLGRFLSTPTQSLTQFCGTTCKELCGSDRLVVLWQGQVAIAMQLNCVNNNLSVYLCTCIYKSCDCLILSTEMIAPALHNLRLSCHTIDLMPFGWPFYWALSYSAKNNTHTHTHTQK
ncbi:unnamed protein product [Ceratitis capitata]|uniref:(Mediterranean fruit fly) hypothetical protein n=1 Tax=Ceratitis capitata TaxID=7213 RepID=A0A811UIY5_CERCA|nr:unnamed protein product [Ceratitis capitata]